MLHVTPVRAFRDNYIWILQSSAAEREIVIVDPGDAAPVIDAIEHNNWQVAAILLTHHHADHVGGVLDLTERYNVPVYGPQGTAIRGITHHLDDGDTVALDTPALTFEVGVIPGHTLDHIYFYGHGAVFCGDTLFSAGCGRLFEGTAEQMHTSLSRLRHLPDATRVFCAHEYTLDNLKFAGTVEPDNLAIDDYTEYTHRLLRQGVPTLPSHIGLEKKVNPFLRCDQTTVREAVANETGAMPDDDVAVFAALRRWKDQF